MMRSVSRDIEPPPLLTAKGLWKHFRLPGGFRRPSATIRAIEDVSFGIRRGEILGIVGESGCGKSTVARLLLHLIPPDSGEILFEGAAVRRKTTELKSFRRQVQMVFQDSQASLNPRLRIEDSIAFGPVAHGAAWAQGRRQAREILASVGLEPNRFASRYPHELSGGQRQRVNIARALVLNPSLVVFDEAVSALDKSIEVQILSLIERIKARGALTYVFISHDLNVVQHISDRVMVMYLGKIVEMGPKADLYNTPRHPYTQALLASRLSLDPQRRTTVAPLVGDPPNPINPPSGCRFRTRCARAMDACARLEPSLEPLVNNRDHQVACLAVDDRIGVARE